MGRIVYHPQLVAVYHQAAGRCTLTRDEIQPAGLMIYTALRAVMIYQACGLDKKRSNFWQTKVTSFLVEVRGIDLIKVRLRRAVAGGARPHRI